MGEALMAVLKIRRGRAPNCSAVGSVVGIAIASAVVGSALLNAWADRFLAWTRGGPGGDGGGRALPEPEAPPHPDDDPPRLRREAFGGIVAWASPPSLLYLDHDGADRAARAGAVEVGVRAPEQVAGALRAPTEAHLPVTGRCPADCAACYVDLRQARAEPTFDDLRARLTQLAELGVFEVAFGGGEVLLRDDVVELAAEARRLGLVPNITTSGFGLTPDLAARLAPLVGQVNVSLDGLGDTYAAVRGWDGVDLALDAIDTLVAAGVRVGVNTVIARPNLDQLDALADELVRRDVGEWLWLRCKPGGPADAWELLAPEPARLQTLWPRALAIERRTGLSLRFDCALTPFVACHEPPRELAERLGLVGCVGGESLWTGTLDGGWRPCSFAPGSAPEGLASSLADRWAGDSELLAWRGRAKAPAEPCASCDWHPICRGGCRSVAARLTGDPMAPDPQCPRVRAASGAAA